MLHIGTSGVLMKTFAVILKYMHKHSFGLSAIQGKRIDHVIDLAIVTLCLTAIKMDCVLIRTAQQGKQANSRMRIPLWRMTPTCLKFPLPKVCGK